MTRQPITWRIRELEEDGGVFQVWEGRKGRGIFGTYPLAERYVRERFTPGDKVLHVEADGYERRVTKHFEPRPNPRVSVHRHEVPPPSVPVQPRRSALLRGWR